MIKPALESTTVDLADSGAWVERLARLGHLLAGQLEPEPLLDRAAELFGELFEADATAVATVEGDRARLRAYRGLTGPVESARPRTGPVESGRSRNGPVESGRPGTEAAGERVPTDAATGEPPLAGESPLFGPTVGERFFPGPAAGRRPIPDAVTGEWPVTDTAAGEPVDALSRWWEERTGASLELRTALRVPVRRDGRLTAVLLAARSWPFPPEAARFAAIFADYLSVAMVNAELYRTLQLRATHDPLTGLANRVLVSQRLDRVLAPGRPGLVGLLFCDLDRFKAVNDLLGHEAGDELLQQVADQLRACVRPGDLLARFGGDEFLVVLDQVRSLSDVAEVGARVARALDREFLLRGTERVKVSASVGGVLGVPGKTNSSLMLRHADAALYAAKDRGLGQVEVFDDAASHRSLDRLDLRAEVGHAIERDQLQVLYQPIIDLAGDRVVAFEAQLRWHHPRHGWVPAEVLVPLAEDTGQLEAIGDWLLDRACRQLAAWRELPGVGDLAVSVDVAADQLNQPGAAARLLRVIRAAGLPPASVWLEVTQHRFRGEELFTQADRLRAAGVRFVLDGFGTAYSNLRFLRVFPVQVLKIDLASVSEVACWLTDPTLVKAILAIAGSLRLTAIGNGLRPGREYEALRDLGCQLGQGPLPPMTARQATAHLRDHGAG